MLKTILVGLNGSRYSQAAVEAAVAWAALHRARLLGLSVLDLPRLTAPESTPLGAGAFKRSRDEAVLAKAEQQAEQLLEAFRARCTAAGLACDTKYFEGDPASVLALQAQQADLLVVGRKTLPHEAGEPPSLVLETLLRHTSRPVLSVAQEAAGGGAVLVAYDGSPQAAKALQLFAALGLADGRDIHVLCVTQKPEERHAELAAAYLGAHGHAAHLHVHAGAFPPETTILEEAKRLDAGIIVMGSFGQSKLKEVFFGSVTRAVLRHSTLPLFLYA